MELEEINIQKTRTVQDIWDERGYKANDPYVALRKTPNGAVRVGMDTILNEGDEIIILPAIKGG